MILLLNTNVVSILHLSRLRPKLAKAFGVSLDYLVGEGVNAAFDEEMINQLENVENLPQEEKERIFHFIDLIIRDHKTGQAYANK